MFRCFEHSLLDQEFSVSFHALHLGLRSWAVEPTQAMPRAPFGEIVLEDCWSTSWNHETPWLLQQSSSNIMVILEKMILPLSQGDIPRIFITWAQLRSVRRKAGSHLDVTVAATNWTSNRDVIFCSIFKHTMKVWCWSPKNCIFDVRCWMLADSGTASWCEVGCDAYIFSAVGCGAFGNPPEEHVWEIGWSGWNECFSDLPCPQTQVVSLFKPQFMTPPSQQRIEGKWISVCQLWAMMTQEERESSIPSCQKEVWSRWRRKTWVPLRAQASHHITSKPGGFEYVWITQYLAKQQDQVWMVQAPHFPGPKEDKSQMHSNARWAFASSTITTRAMAQSQRCLGKDWDVRWHRSKCP